MSSKESEREEMKEETHDVEDMEQDELDEEDSEDEWSWIHDLLIMIMMKSCKRKHNEKIIESSAWRGFSTW